jgi:hypothetical protein
MRKKEEIKRESLKVCFIILNLMISIIAFSFLVGATLPRGQIVPIATTGGNTLSEGASYSSALTESSTNYLTNTYAGGSEGIFKLGQEYTITQTKSGFNLKIGEDLVSLDSKAGNAFLKESGLKFEPAKSDNFVSKLFGVNAGTGWDAILTGAQWALIAYGIGYMIGSLFGMSKQNTQALATAMAAGMGFYKMASTYNFAAEGAMFGPKWAWLSNPLVGIGIGVAVFLIMYKKTDTQVVTFDCLTWQAPTGGNDCEICNDDTLPCSEYRCRSLGQNCELVNQGTTQEKCVNINPRDVNPPLISPNYNVITEGHKYTNVKTSPPGPGFEIVNLNSSDGCLKAFTPLKFGITANEPAQCKIDFNHTTKFDEMVAFIGGSNLYLYNHTEQFSLPGAKTLEGSGLILENGKDITFFIRCKDKNGNENTAEYAVKMCIDPSPDTTPPIIKATSILNEGCVAENQNVINVEFYTNEPANCRWSSNDQSYENMQNQMACTNELYQINANQLFTCRTNLTGVLKEGTKYYIRCEDQPNAEPNDRNKNKESFIFSLRGSTALKITKLLPNGTIFKAVNPAPIELYVQTLFGCNNGLSICYYSTTGNEEDFIMFYDTNNEDGISTQQQNLGAGNHKYYIKCIDEGGNIARDTIEFTLDIDTSAPVIARIYEEGGMLKIMTIKKSECAYSFINCDFTLEEGAQMPYANSTSHIAEWNKDKTYYIKCRDEFRNEDADCSVIVRPGENLFAI